SLRAINLQCGGKIEETLTRFCAAMPASRSANSKEVSRSLCFPTPLVRKMRFGTMFLPNLSASRGGDKILSEFLKLTHAFTQCAKSGRRINLKITMGLDVTTFGPR